MGMTEAISPELEKALQLFASSRISINELRTVLDRQFFLHGQDIPIDREVIGELDIALSEYDWGIRRHDHLLSVASLLLQKVRSQSAGVNQPVPWIPFEIPVEINVALPFTYNFRAHYTYSSPDVEYGFGKGEPQKVIAQESAVPDYLDLTSDLATRG